MLINMKTITITLAVCLTAILPVNAFWRLLCHGQLGVARIDPIVSYGAIAPHAHAAAGASNLGTSSTFEDLMSSNCTSCSVTQDRSAYWAPALYFNYDNGSYQLVPQDGGMTVYYFNDNGENLTAFPPGFRMVAGNNNLRSYPYEIPYPDMSDWTAAEMTQPALAAKSIGFNCLNYTKGFATEGSMEYHYLRNKTFLDAQCLDGVRLEIQFPSCWDGVHLDSPEHNTHILYPPQLKTGECPIGFKVRTPVMFYETIWQTNLFVNYTGQFVISNGDTEGYGYHADFMAGWNQKFLQEAVDTCNAASGLQEDCPLFDLQTDSDAISCHFDLPIELQDEDCAGPLSALPGNVPIQVGPANATKLSATPLGGPTCVPGGTVYSGVSTNAVNTDAYNGSSNTSAGTRIPIEAPTSHVSPPMITSPPNSTSATENIEVVSTTTFISDGQDVVMVIYEAIVTVTATPTPAKRSVHKHGRMHVRV